MPPDPARPHIAVCPGSYDPITNGHLDVITRASEIFDELIIAVVNASVRKDRALFPAEDRVRFIESATSHLANVRVDTFDVLITEYARRVGASAIVKGLRAISDFEYELEMNQLNRHLARDIESVYLMASPQYSFLSSSGVKEIATFGGNVSDLVPDEVARRLKEALAR
jgi:pantetheine-phosphate adenylyltransferase